MSNCLGKVGIIWNRGSDIYYVQYSSKATIWIIRSTITGHHYSTSRTRYLYHLYIFLSILSIYLFICIIYIIYIVIYLIYISLSSLSIYFCYISYLYIVIYLIYISLRSKRVWVLSDAHFTPVNKHSQYWLLIFADTTTNSADTSQVESTDTRWKVLKWRRKGTAQTKHLQKRKIYIWQKRIYAQEMVLIFRKILEIKNVADFAAIFWECPILQLGLLSSVLN